MATSQKQRECTICKHYGDENSSESRLERENLFDETGAPIPVILCRKHSVQLFKMGQQKFLVSHYKILAEIISTDEGKFLEILDKTVRDNKNKIY